MPPQQGYQFPPNQAPMHAPKKRGTFSKVIVPLILVILLLASLGFAYWAYGGRQDYKDNSDKKATIAVAAAVKDEDAKKDAAFAEAEKNPLKTYKGPATFGSVEVSYPKTWSAYVIQTDKGSTPPVDGYFHPNFVPGTQTGSAYALRVQVLNQSYDTVLKQFDSAVKSGKVTVKPYTSKNVPNVTGVRIDGAINQDQTGSIVLLPMRDKTLKISTEATEFESDFNNLVLPSLKFVP